MNISDPRMTEGGRADYASAEVTIGTTLTVEMPYPSRLRLYHSPGTGYDNIDTTLLPPGATLCNCFGHENAMAEYVVAALPLLRRKRPSRVHELRGHTYPL